MTRSGSRGAAVTALIDRLERAGYVTRERGSSDRRRITVHANREKLGEIDALYASQGARMKKLLSRYSAEEFQVIMDFLQQTTGVLTTEEKALKNRKA